MAWLILFGWVAWIVLQIGNVSLIISPGIHFIAIVFPIIGLAQSASNKDRRSEDRSLSSFGSTSENNQTDRGRISDAKQAVKTGYIYLRQSQFSPDDDDTEGEENSSSIQAQKQTSKAVGKEHGIDNFRIFKDVNESGYSLDRDGFQLLKEALEREPNPVIMDRIDRLGRETLETIYVAAIIHYQYDVPIITAHHGRYELDKIDEQLDLVLNAIIAGKSVRNRVRAAWDTIKMRFGDERKWNTWFNKVPVAYQLDGDEWIEPSPHATKVITAIIHDLLETTNRAQTADRIRKAVNNQSLNSSTSEDEVSLASLSADQIRSAFEGSGYDPENFDGSQLKRLLTNPILIGEVRYPRSASREEQSVIEDPPLQVIDEDLFDEITSFIEENRDKNSTDTEENVDTKTLAELGLLLLAVDEIEWFKPVCPECNRGMVKNGADSEHPLEDGRVAHYWVCPKYTDDDGTEPDCQRKVPLQKEWQALQNHFEEEHTDYSDIVALKVCPPVER